MMVSGAVAHQFAVHGGCFLLGGTANGANYWQKRFGLAGRREFPKWAKVPDYYLDPDSGPVIAGFGTSASGLGLGAARLHNDAERAGKLGAEMLASAVPTINGRLLLPWLVSDRVHAPYFAEITLLHQLSLLPMR